MKEEIICGVDPGTAITGYGIIKVIGGRTTVVDYGVIRAPATKPLSMRYRIIYESLQKLLVQYKPTALAIETQYVSKNVQSAIKLGMARGVAVLVAALLEIEVFEYAPTKAKKAVLGSGSASKHQVQRMVKMLLGLPELPEPEDAADALSIALCHSHLLATNRHKEFQV